MKLLRKSDGEWFTHPGGARFLVRPIPKAKEREIDYKHFGRTRNFEFHKGVQRISVDVDKWEAAQADKAAFALVGTEDAELDVPAGAEEAFGGVAAGSNFVLDKHWTPEIAKAVFAELPELADWVVEQAKVGKATAVAAEGKEERT